MKNVKPKTGFILKLKNPFTSLKLKQIISYLQRRAKMNVIAGSILLMAHEKVGEVSFNPA